MGGETGISRRHTWIQTGTNGVLHSSPQGYKPRGAEKRGVCSERRNQGGFSAFQPSPCQAPGGEKGRGKALSEEDAEGRAGPLRWPPRKEDRPRHGAARGNAAGTQGRELKTMRILRF